MIRSAVVLRAAASTATSRSIAVGRNGLSPALSFVDDLRLIVGADNVDQASDKYTVDWTRKYMGGVPGGSTVVVFPRSTAHVSALLAFCHEKRIGVVPQGGNTGLVGGGVPRTGGNELVLSLEKMRSIVSIDEGVLVAEAGCVLEALSTAAAEHGYLVPLDLGAKVRCVRNSDTQTHVHTSSRTSSRHFPLPPCPPPPAGQLHDRRQRVHQRGRPPRAAVRVPAPHRAGAGGAPLSSVMSSLYLVLYLSSSTPPCYAFRWCAPTAGASIRLEGLSLSLVQAPQPSTFPLRCVDPPGSSGWRRAFATHVHLWSAFAASWTCFASCPRTTAATRSSTCSSAPKGRSALSPRSPSPSPRCPRTQPSRSPSCRRSRPSRGSYGACERRP